MDREEIMSWRDEGIERGGEEACDEASDFRGSGFASLEFTNSLHPETPISRYAMSSFSQEWPLPASPQSI
jgi:hypothetical protein